MLKNLNTIMLLFQNELDDGVAILLMVLAIIIIGLLMWWLIRSISKERIKYSEDHMLKGKIEKKQLMEIISKRLSSGTKSSFCLVKIELSDISVENTSYKTDRNDALYAAVIKRILGVFGNLSKICKDDDGGLLIYNTTPSVNMNISAHCKFLCEELSKNFVFSDAYSLDLTFYISAVKYPQEENTLEALSKNLDMAMAIAKRNGANSFVVYSANIETQNSDEYRYFRELKTAIERKEFVLYYQPVIELSSDTVIGYETLLRWNHSSLGVLSPASFLRILEQTGDINWVGFWAFERLLQDYTLLTTKVPGRQFTMFMNLSARQLSNPKLLDELRRILKKHDVSPHNICFDVVEEDIYKANSDIKRNLDLLKTQGFKLAIDNFGLEASSLTRLERIDVSAIKLDKSLFDEESEFTGMTKNILEILARYSAEKNIILVSLGIENLANANFAKQNGIHYGQGYFFARPKPFEEAMLSASSTLLANAAANESQSQQQSKDEFQTQQQDIDESQSQQID